MKVAICIAGQLRTFEKTFPSIKKNIVDELRADLFISTWDKLGKTHKTDSSIEKNEIVDAEKIKRKTGAKIVDVQIFEDKFYDKMNNVEMPQILKEREPLHSRSMIPHFYKIHRCNQLRILHEKNNRFVYDVIIRIRPDMKIENKITPIFEKINLHNTIYVSSYAINSSFQLSDKFVIMNREVADYYSSVWENLQNYWNSPLGADPPRTTMVGERLLFQHMKRANINVEFFNLGGQIIR
jgi:hypothetical protein